MSSALKINYTILSIIGTALFTSFTVLWMAAGKAAAIDTANINVASLQVDVEELHQKENDHSQMLSRLDERTIQILKILETRLK